MIFYHISLAASFQVSLPLIYNGNEDNDFDKLCSAEFLLIVFLLVFPSFKTTFLRKITVKVIKIYLINAKKTHGSKTPKHFKENQREHANQPESLICLLRTFHFKPCLCF